MMTEFSRPVDLASLSAEPQMLRLAAKPEECSAVAQRLGLEALHDLNAEFELLPLGRDIRLTGSLRAEVRQSCGVSLETFDETIIETLDVRYTPELSDEDIEAIDFEDPREPLPQPFDLGEEMVQFLALALDPYPRRPGVASGLALAEEPDTPMEGADTQRPFADLKARLHDAAGSSGEGA